MAKPDVVPGLRLAHAIARKVRSIPETHTDMWSRCTLAGEGETKGREEPMIILQALGALAGIVLILIGGVALLIRAVDWALR